MKVKLLVPNFTWRTKCDFKKDPPLGVLYIASVIRSESTKVNVIDAFSEDLSFENAMNKILEDLPDVLGISCNYSPLHNIVLDVVRYLKEVAPSITIVVGGNHATASHEHLLREANGNIDYIILGQGEYVFKAFLEKFREGIPQETKGISYLNMKGAICKNEVIEIIDLKKMPLPAYDLVNMSLYDRYNVITSRGCPFNCNYCASNVITGNKVYYRDPYDVVTEIEYLIGNYGKKMIWFSDDTFTGNIEYTNRLLDIIISKELEIEWSCLTRVNRTNFELLEKMKEAGCKYISYGIETGDPEMLINLNKGIKLSEIKDALDATQRAGIEAYGFFLVGYPGENESTIQSTFDLIKKSALKGVSFAIVIPLPGTLLWQYLESNQLISWNEIQWDMLFAKSGYDDYERYVAELASGWCSLSAERLLEICEVNEINEILNKKYK